MDPLTQGVVGATLSQASSQKRSAVWATILGWLSGMAPDLDILIRSDVDALLYLEYHRQFTHSIAFIPVGGFLCALFFHLLLGRISKLTFLQTYFFCTLGVATHGLLDAATSYGTQLFWPFSDLRVAFNNISIIDPLFTLPLLVLILIGLFSKSPKFGKFACVWVMLYMSFGLYQNHQALKVGEEIALNRGHVPTGLSAKPSFGNLLVWKIIYRDGDTYYVDAVKTFFGSAIFEGTSIKALDIAESYPWLDEESQQRKDIERFRWFSDGHLAQDPDNPMRIIDLRYSQIPNEINGLWSIELSRDADIDQHVDFVTHRGDARDRVGLLWGMMTTKTF